MNKENQFEWVDFYEEFAIKLLDYKNKRNELVEKVKEIYQKTGLNMPTLESDNNIIDIDPFTIFGLFNKKLKDKNRIKIITAISELFHINSKVPTSFNGLPVLNPLNATFYNFIDEREDTDIDDLWNLFESALKYANDSSIENKAVFSKYFNSVINKKGNGNGKITMALYWISPKTFLNLDGCNEQYIYESDNIPSEIVNELPPLKKRINAEKYFKISDSIQNYLKKTDEEFNDFASFSYNAWVYSEKINQNKKLEKENNKSSKAAFLRWFAPVIQALRDLGGSATPADVRSKIIENENLTDEDISVTRGKSNVNKFVNEVAFARNYLVSAGYIDKNVYGVWTLTEEGKTVEMTDELASNIFKSVMSDTPSKKKEAVTSLADEDVRKIRYWLYAPGRNSCKWDEFYDAGIMAIGWGEIGDLSKFETKEAMKETMKEVYNSGTSYMNSAHATWQFANEMKIGDIVFVKKGMYKIVGYGIVMSDYEFDSTRKDNYNNIRQVNWLYKGEWDHPGQAAMKTLTDITDYKDYVEQLNALFVDETQEDEEDIEIAYPTYTKEDFLSQVYMSEEEYNKLIGILRMKKNIILQGAPGVGKTFIAKKLAFSVMGVKDIDRVMMVQFHQSYSYEDFIMGFRPSEDGFKLNKGVFYNFCKKAEVDGDNDYFFIIDEINRGNLSKIFGELFMLIESDKRGHSLQLLYSNETFSIPKNVYIIGMMNTADRSLAMLDYALRRRFAFFEIKPGFTSDGFIKYRTELESEKFDKLITCVEKLNDVILNDESLGEGFCIGHSYFCNLTRETVDAQTLSSIVEYELIPLLKEYWFDEPMKVRDWSNNLRSAIK